MLETGRRPKIIGIFLLKCPYCLKEPLRSSWFSFREGCPHCHYRYEREPGYFLGSPWMINYPITAAIAFLGTYLMFVRYPQLHPLLKATAITLVAVLSSLGFYPFSRAIWLVGDHLLNPLTERDYWDGTSSQDHETNR